MLGTKAPNIDTYGLFRAVHSHNPTQYSHIVGLKSHDMRILGGSKIHSPTYELAHVGE